MKSDEIKKMRPAAGRSHLINYLAGKQLSHLQAIRAKCFDCCYGYADGHVDCTVTACPLYPFMKYKGKEG